MNISQVLQVVSRAGSAAAPIYLVGGAVRDRILGQGLHDLDFAMRGNTRQTAKLAADALEGAFYPLDEERGTYRVILQEPAGEKLVLDFAVFRGDDLESDLRGRDFTINAMALDLEHLDTVIDPCGGQEDLKERRLRACSPLSLQEDPIRAMRAVRFTVAHRLQMDADVRRQALKAASLMKRVSAERVRDELFRILDGENVVQGVRLLERLNLMQECLPELAGLNGLQQSPPHIYSGWEHTLDVAGHLEELWNVLVEDKPAAASQDPLLAEASHWLGRYHGQFKHYYDQQYGPDRQVRGLVMLAGLYHDCAKPLTRSVDPDGRIRFFKHEERGARLVTSRARSLALSSEEIDRLERIVSGHMRIHHLVDARQEPGPRAVYHFHRDTGIASVDICLLSLADLWGTYGHTLSLERWLNEVKMCWVMLEALWDRPEQAVAPPRIINGDDLIKSLGLTPGPVIGRILEAVREAQTAGEVTDRESALNLARAYLNKV
jgi:tRNA nucleotidyltransferase/poly(A) polymerase